MCVCLFVFWVRLVSTGFVCIEIWLMPMMIDNVKLVDFVVVVVLFVGIW